ncbi:MAG: lysylphosphatidylglycerol synthase transmembrane domain-containing protein [Hasllibacter sp.]
MTMAPHAPTIPGRPRALRWAVPAILLGGTAIGLVALAAATGWAEVARALAAVGPWGMAALLVLSLVNYAARGLRWHLMARALALPIGMRRNLLHFLGGFAFTITPVRAGELVRLRWIARETGWRAERAAPLVLADRAGDLAAMALILAAATVLATAEGTALAAPVAALALIGALLVTRPALALGALNGAHLAAGRRAPRAFARARRAARGLSAVAAPRLWLPALALGLAGWLAEGWAFHLMLGWMGAEIPFATAILIFVFATLAGGLTGAPGGIGGAEAAMVALLTLQGVPPAISVPATAVIRVTTLWFAILIGIALAPFAERTAR